MDLILIVLNILFVSHCTISMACHSYIGTKTIERNEEFSSTEYHYKRSNFLVKKLCHGYGDAWINIYLYDQYILTLGVIVVMIVW